MSEFTKWLQTECRRKGWGVSALATNANAPVGTAQGWLRGSKPSWEYCASIAAAFGQTPAFVRQLAGYGDEAAETAVVTASAPADPREEALLHVWRHGRPGAQRALEAIVELEADSGTGSTSRRRPVGPRPLRPASQAQR